jgi:hypothetical protein
MVEIVVLPRVSVRFGTGRTEAAPEPCGDLPIVSEIDLARDALVAASTSIEVTEIFQLGGGPDGHGWLLQEVTARGAT